MSNWATDYVDVAERLTTFFERFPEGSIQCQPAEIKTIEGKTFISVIAVVYRNQQDAFPSIAEAWEPFPGTTNFTRNSECMNAGTSAVGRALALVGLHTKRSLATKQEVANRVAEQQEPAKKPAAKKPVDVDTIIKAINDATTKDQLEKLGASIKTHTPEIDPTQLAIIRALFLEKKKGI